MRTDYINIGSSPCDESCIQVGSQDYMRKSKLECLHFIEAIRKKLGNEPDGATLKVKSFPHDFGSYREVVCEFEEENEKAMEYAFRCESDAPYTWAEVGMKPPSLG